MVFLDNVQNLHIHAEKTHKDFGAHCMKYVNFVHDPEKQEVDCASCATPFDRSPGH